MTGTKLTALLALSAAAFAQPAAPKPGHVDGSVTNAKTGAPVANVLVRLIGSKTYGARTAADGTFSWDTIEPGEYQLATMRRGYSPAFEQISVRAEAPVRARELKIVPDGVIRGHVFDENGDPVENVTVEAVASGPFAIATGTTDDRGEFRLATQVTCRVRAVPREMPMPEEIRSDGTHETAYRTTYFPGVPDARGASSVEVEPGVERGGIDIRLIPMPILRVTGVVEGVPQGADNVWAYFRSDDTRPNQAPVKNGRFTAWRLAPGKYIVSAGAHGGDARTYTSFPQEIELAKDHIDNLRFELVPEFDVRGFVQWDGPPAAADPSKPPEVHLESHDDWVRRPDKPLRGTLGQDLTFRIPKVTVGAYEIALKGLPESVWVKSIAVNGHDSPDPYLELRGAPETVTLLLATATGQVSGVVQDENGPAADARVYLTPQRPFGWILERQQTTAAGGKYSFDGVPPGKYTVSLRRPPQRSSLTTPEPPPADSDQSATIDLAEGSRVTQNLKAKN